MCGCEKSGCLTNSCSCKKIGSYCTKSCTCRSCHNRPEDTQSPTIQSLSQDMKSLQKTVNNIAAVAETVRVVTGSRNSSRAAGISDSLPIASGSEVSQVARSTPSASKTIPSQQPAHSYASPSLHAQGTLAGVYDFHQPQTQMVSAPTFGVVQSQAQNTSAPSYQQHQPTTGTHMVSYEPQQLAPYGSPQVQNQQSFPLAFSNIYSLIATGGVTKFCEDLERDGFRLQQADANSRLYDYCYPGTPAVDLQVYILGLPDKRVQVQVRGINSEIFNQFIAFLSKYR